MLKRWSPALALLAVAAATAGCSQTPDLNATADDTIEIVSTDGTLVSGKIVRIQNADGTMRKMVVMDRTVPYAGQGVQPAVYQPAVYRTPTVAPAASRTAAQSRTANGKRSVQKSALIIGGSAGAGALVGGLAKGKKGAAIGALAGGLGGLAYDLITRNRS